MEKINNIYRKITFVSLLILLLCMAYDANAQSTKLPTDDVFDSSEFAAYATDYETFGRVMDATAIDGSHYGLLRSNGLLTIYDTNQNLTDVKNTGLNEPAWVKKLGDEYWFGSGVTVSKGTFNGQNYSVQESQDFLGLSGIMTAGDIDSVLGLYISDGAKTYRADFGTGNVNDIFNGGATAINILAFQPDVYATNFMLQADGEYFSNMHNNGDIFSGSSTIADFNNYTDIMDVVYLDDRMIVVQEGGNQDHALPVYANNFANPVPEPGAVFLFAGGAIYLRKKFRNGIK